MKLEVKVDSHWHHRRRQVQNVRLRQRDCPLAIEWLKGKTVDKPRHQEYRHRHRVASSEDSLLGAGGRRDQSAIGDYEAGAQAWGNGRIAI
jgi:hypothetical protein